MYGYTVLKLVGKQRKQIGFFNDLGMAKCYVFEEQLLRIVKGTKVNLDHIARAEKQIDRIIEHMDTIRDEILGVSRGE